LNLKTRHSRARIDLFAEIRASPLLTGEDESARAARSNGAAADLVYELVEQNPLQASIICRRFSNRSPRRYAASTLSPTTWARAISATSDGNSLRSAAQSLKVERKPCVVSAAYPMRRSVMSSAILL